MKSESSKKIISFMDPLVDPCIFYFIIAGFVKPIVFSIIDATEPGALARPIVGQIWYGFDASVVSTSIAYLMSAGFLIMVRSKYWGERTMHSISDRTSKRLTILLAMLAILGVAETNVIGSRYVGSVILPLYFGWLSTSSGKVGLAGVLLISGLTYLATLSKWVIIGLPAIFTVSASLVAGAVLIAAYPLLNQIRYFVIGLSLGYSVNESIQLLQIKSFDIVTSVVSLLYRMQSFESSYVTSGIGRNVSALNLSQTFSFDIYQLDYGIAVSLFAQLEYAMSSSVLAGVFIFLITVIFVLSARTVVHYAPSLTLVLGLQLPMILTDGFVPNRALYFATGVTAFLILIWTTNFRVRFRGSDGPHNDNSLACRHDLR